MDKNNDHSTSYITAVLGLLTLFLLHRYWPSSTRGKKAVHELRILPFAAIWPFFNKRFDFIWDNFRKTGEALYQFRILQHRVVVVSGIEGRKIFFNDRNLNFVEGYKILMGGVSRIEDVNVEYEKIFEDNPFNKQLLSLFHKSRVSNMIPTLFEDIYQRSLDWGKEGRIDPFQDVYNLVFQMTVRLSTCHEFSENAAEVARLSYLHSIIEGSATPVALLLPWFPGSAKRKREQATRELYDNLNGYIERRRAASTPNTDAIDFLISEGADNPSIIGLIMAIVSVGVGGTGTAVCWVLLFLAAYPEWKEKVSKEILALIEKHTDPTSSEPLHKRLSEIPLSAWENEMPVVEAVIRETLRLIPAITLLRRNVAQDISIEERTIERGAFMAYNVADVHLNSSIYSDPHQFDPERFSEGRAEDKKAPLSFVGWGAGRHPCSGMKIAKLEMKMVITFFLSGYECKLVDESGKFPDPFPKPDRNDIQKARPLGKPCYLQFRKFVE